MTSGWAIAFIALWVLVLVLAAVMLATLRQLGLIHVRLGGSLGARQTTAGPAIGEQADVDALERVIDRRMARSEVFLLTLMSPTCSVCEPMIPHLPSFVMRLRPTVATTVVLIAADRHGKFAPLEASDVPVLVDERLAELLGIESYPYALATSADGTVLSKGVFNDMMQLESVVTAAESFLRSLNEPQPLNAGHPANAT